MKQMLENGTVVKVGKNGVTLTLPDGSIELIDEMGRNVTANELFKVAKEGDYVEYTPNISNYMVGEERSGVEGTQNFKPMSCRKWQVLRKFDDKVELIAVAGQLALCGKIGYDNAINIMNDVARMHINPIYASDARAIGSMYASERKNSRKMGLGEAEAGYISSDFGYENDLLCLGTGKITIPCNTWLASECSYGLYWDVVTCEIRSLQSGIMSNTGVLSKKTKEGKTAEYTRTKQLLVAVLLMRDVKVCGGDGSEANPFKIRK